MHSVHSPQRIVNTGDLIDGRSGISTQNKLHVTCRKKIFIGLISSIVATQSCTRLGRQLTKSWKSAVRGFAKRSVATKIVSNAPAEKSSETGDSPQSSTPGIVRQLISSDSGVDTSALRLPNQLRHIVASFKTQKSITRPRAKRTKSTRTERETALSSSAADEIRLAMKSIRATRRLRTRKQQKEPHQNHQSFEFCQRCLCV